MAQTRYYVFRFTSANGTRATLCTTSRDEWDDVLQAVDGWTPWLLPWENTRSYGHEADAPDNNLARVNLAHVMSIETWSVLR